MLQEGAALEGIKNHTDHTNLRIPYLDLRPFLILGNSSFPMPPLLIMLPLTFGLGRGVADCDLCRRWLLSFCPIMAARECERGQQSSARPKLLSTLSLWKNTQYCCTQYRICVSSFFSYSNVFPPKARLSLRSAWKLRPRAWSRAYFLLPCAHVWKLFMIGRWRELIRFPVN